MGEVLKKTAIMEAAKDLGESFLSFFYIINPWKTSFKTPEEVPNYIASAYPWFASLILLERIILYAKGKSPPVNDSLAAIGTGMFQEFANLFAKSSVSIGYMYINEHYGMFMLPWDSPITWIISAIFVDFGYYWLHRAAHEVNLFWSQHQVHHSSEEYNMATAIRQGVFQGYYTWLFYLPLAFFIPPSHFAAHVQFNLLWQFWLHTELIDDMGPLEWVFNTPSHHRVHHGSTRYCIDKNYAGVLIIWDRIFGTFAAERREEPMVYGLIGQINFFNPLYLEFYYWGKMYEKVKSVDGIANKLRAIFYGPGWFPGTPRLGDYEQLPEKIEREKFSRPLSFNMALYAFIHTIFLALTGGVLIENYEVLEQSKFIMYTVFILGSFSSLGLLYDEHPLAPWLEMIRCLVFVGFTIRHPFTIETLTGHIALYVLRIYHFYSAWIFKNECVDIFTKMTPLKEKDC